MADGGDGRPPPLLRIGSRIVVDGHYGTVRYVGAVDSARPDAIFYGVEWDDPSRGRHSGEHHGIRLFECRMPGAGSFVRATPKVHGARCSIAEAVVAKYADKDAATVGHRGMTVITTANDRKAIEMIGFEGILAKQRCAHLFRGAIALSRG